jgi:hypothetical protein
MFLQIGSAANPDRPALSAYLRNVLN